MSPRHDRGFTDAAVHSFERSALAADTGARLLHPPP